MTQDEAIAKLDPYGGMEASDVKRLKELEEENRRLKQMYADLSLRAQTDARRHHKSYKPVPSLGARIAGAVWC